MASVRSGITLSVGPIATIVAIESATTRPKVPQTVCLGQHEPHDPSPGRKPHLCDICGPITDYSRTAKAMRIGDSWHLLGADELKELSAELSEPFKSPSFTPHPREQVEALTVSGEKRYNLVPSAAHHNYGNIRSAVKANPDLCFVSLFTPRSVASLFVLEAVGDVLVMVERTLASGLKELPKVDAAPDAFEPLVCEAVKTLVADFDAQSYGNTYVAAAAERFAASTEIIQLDSPTRPAAASPVTEGDSLAAALEAMLAAKAKPVKRTARKRTSKPVKVA